MSSISRVFNSSRALLAAAKAGTAKSSAKPATTKSSAAKTSAASKRRVASPSSAKQPRTLGRPTGILKVAPVSPVLAKFLGVPEASRTDAVKKIWEYIKVNNLQNPANKREIQCDNELKTIFEGKEKVGFLEVGRLLSHHFVKN